MHIFAPSLNHFKYISDFQLYISLELNKLNKLKIL